MLLGQLGRPSWRLTAMSVLLLVLAASHTSALAACVGSIYALTGSSVTPRPFEEAQLIDQYLMVFRTAIDSRPWHVVIEDHQSDPRVLISSGRKIAEQDGCSAVISTRWGMSWLNGNKRLRGFGMNNPFANLTDVYKQFSNDDPRKVTWVVIGWIQKNWPGLEVKQEGDTTVITMEENQRGWPDYGFGLFGAWERFPADEMMDWIASPRANELMGRWFYVVPDNSLLRRRVRIDLVSKDKAVIASTACDSSSCYPTMALGEAKFKSKTTAEEHSVCGKNAACPQFMPRPNFGRVP